jgi:uncharacterized membrane protein YphA (DoxX/SURF4 family)
MLLKIFTHISRVFVGLLFIYSGFVKLVDPMGTQFKMEEYFSEAVLNLEFLTPLALPISILLVVSELVLGVMLIMGWKPKFTVWSLFGLTLFLLFLTWYSYAYNKVTDCGCFGDAIKISPKQTFYKNVIFIGLIGVLIAGLKHIKPLFSKKIATYTSITSLVISLAIVFYVLNHLPIIDFRAYSVGTNIAEGMKYQGDGEVPPIHDFEISTDEGDLLEEMLAKEKAMLLFVNTVDKADEEGLHEVSKVAAAAKSKGYEIYVLSSDGMMYDEEELGKFKEKYNLPYIFGTCDGTAIKTAIRANPGIMTVKKGIIVGKWSWTDTDDVKL